jgi:type IV pilus assembly protein PilC
MDVFSYKAMNAQGQLVRGRIGAENLADLERRLGTLGLDLVKYQKLSSVVKFATGTRVKRRDLIVFFFHLEQMLAAGVPILEALADLRDSIEEPRLRQIASGLMDGIEGGKNLSQAMQEYPTVFDGVTCNLVRAGEQTGQVSEVLLRITETLKWDDERAAYTKQLLLYPSFLAATVLLLVFFIMTYLVPQLVSFIKSFQKELPLSTKILIGFSNAFVNYWYLIIGIPLVAIVGLWITVNVNPNVRRTLDLYLLRFPAVGPLWKKLILSRFTSYFAMMYASGITVLECMKIGESVAGNTAVAQAIQGAGAKIADGEGISAAFASTGLFPPLVIRMLRVGENTGALEKSLMNVSYFYTRDVKESIERLQTMIEPSLTLILGAIMAWVIFSVLGPIYDLITKIKI